MRCGRRFMVVEGKRGKVRLTASEMAVEWTVFLEGKQQIFNNAFG
jgi:hypothetical protein